MDRKTLKLRVTSAIILAILFLGSILAHKISFLVFFLFIAYMAGREYARMYKRFHKEMYKPMTGIIAGIMAAIPIFLYFYLVTSFYDPTLFRNLIILANFLTLFLVRDLFSDKPPILFKLPYSIGSFIYPGLFLATPVIVILDIAGNYQKFHLLVMIFCIWSVDVGAYFVGSMWGKHKLFPSLSPNKTIEGAVGGLLASILIGCLAANVFSISILTGLLIGLACGVLGIIGDLYESKLKRTSKLKDSSRIMPGHGGMLDRFDGFIVALPTVSLILWWTLKLG